MKLSEVFNRAKLQHITIEAWKDQAKKWMDTHAQIDNAKLIFTEPNIRGILFAYVDAPEHKMKTFSVGTYYTKQYGDIPAGTGSINE
jgi:hypothetical protein